MTSAYKDLQTGQVVVDAGFVKPDWTPSLADRRAAAVLPRTAFCVAVMRAGHWTAAQASAAAKGEVPDGFEAVLNAAVAAGQLTQAEADEAVIIWAGLIQVERNHPLIPIAAQVYDLDDNQVDTIFGIN